MLRICGITYDHTINYGSCLQAYALQHAIEGVQLSDYSRCCYQIIPIRTFKEGRSDSSFASHLLKPIINFYRSQFRSFEKKHLTFAPVNSLGDLSSLNSTEDAFVCGSDVIWNPDFNNNLNAFYLDFATKYKFSYAASFGKSSISTDTLQKIKKPLSELDSISIREQSGLSIIRQCTDKPVKIVADPVLLLTKQEWENILPKRKNSSAKYIFVYITHLSEPIRNELNLLKEKTGLPIIYSASGPKQALRQGMLQVQTPDKWLRLLHDAEYVVTNSFHATAFSVLFHKNFFTIVNGDKSKGINVRMNDFLCSIGGDLENRIFSELPDEWDLNSIDYTDVDKKIEVLRMDSMEFLRQNLEAAYDSKMRDYT